MKIQFLTHFILSVLFIITGTSQVASQSHGEDLAKQFNAIDFRFIGPGQAGGRISDIEVVAGDPMTIYVSAATGGIFKSSDNCKSWSPIFDKAGTSLSIGDMAISKPNPNIIWAGTGEASGEQSSASVGDGVYKSLDGGDTWINMGLKKSRHISRIQIDNNDPNIVYIAATGARWGENPERGIFKTTDGGASWEKSLFVSDNCGFSDIVLHPEGKILLASAWYQRRNAWAHVQTGPESGLYRSDDSGESWTKLDIFPNEPIGRIALWMAPSDPNIIYACLESKQGGIYRSKDSGKNWKKVNKEQSTSYWYGRLYGNPTDPDNIFVMGVNVNESKDGGKSYQRMQARGVHVDHHILWINPLNTKHRLLGNDGGLYLTNNTGEKWDFISNIPMGQNYAISVDTKEPYTVYGGLQDNGVWGGPSRSESEFLVNNTDIIRICGGDGFYSAAHPANPEIVFGESQYGYLVRRDLRTGDSKRVKPKSAEKNNDRFNWNAPFFISVHPPHSLYVGGNLVFKSLDDGDNWDVISPDLSRNQDLSKELVIGQKPVLKPYASVTALAESPLKPGFLLAGTDDGNLHLSLDDGNTWENLSDRLPMPSDRFFTRVLWSVSDVGTAYVACGRYYEANDLSPYLFKTANFGKTWSKITTGMPEIAVIKGLTEHPNNPNLLFAGSHNDLFMTINGGKTWISPNWNLPRVAIDDIKLAFPDNDLVLGSYGRGIIILDNIDFLTEISPEILHSDFHLYEPQPFSKNHEPTIDPDGDPYFWNAPNPMPGLNLDCYLGNIDSKEAKIELGNREGQALLSVVKTLNTGFNRINIPVNQIPNHSEFVKMSIGGVVKVEKLKIK